MSNRKGSGSRVLLRGYSLVTVTLFILGSGIALLHPAGVRTAITQEKTITLDVAVVDLAGHVISGLTLEEFTVYEDGVKQKISSFNEQESPLSLGIVVDASGSMKSVAHAYREVALKIISQLKPEDEAFLVQFKAEPELIQEFTRDRQALETAVDPVSTGGGTAILDAISAASEYIHLKGRSRRKALVIISDGQEKNSATKDDELLKRLIEDQPQLYFICLPVQGSTLTPGMSEKAREMSNRLAHLSQLTGGQFYYTSTSEGAVKIGAQLMENLHRQYELGYIPANNKPDNVLRKISVLVTPKDGRQIKATTRQNCYGPGYKIIR
jgi:Ca-activated chloride channel homolog